MRLFRETRNFRGNFPSRSHSRYYSESAEIVGGGGRGLTKFVFAIYEATVILGTSLKVHFFCGLLLLVQTSSQYDATGFGKWAIESNSFICLHLSAGPGADLGAVIKPPLTICPPALQWGGTWVLCERWMKWVMRITRSAHLEAAS